MSQDTSLTPGRAPSEQGGIWMGGRGGGHGRRGGRGGRYGARGNRRTATSTFVGTSSKMREHVFQSNG